MSNRFIASLFILISSFCFQSMASAQSIYFSTYDHKLFRHRVDLNADQFMATMMNSGGLHLRMLDIAINPDGELYGVSGQGPYPILYKIDPITGLGTAIGNTIFTVGLTFSADGTLWAVGTPSGFSPQFGLFKIDPATGAETLVVNFGYTPSGDVAVSPVTQKIYMASMMNYVTLTEHLVEIDPISGTLTDRGDFGVQGLYGFDFIDSNETIMARTSAGKSVTMNKVGQSWIAQQSTFNNMGQCTGAATHMCKSDAIITLNQKDVSQATHECGSPLLLNGNLSKHVDHYQWKIAGPDAGGTIQTVIINGIGTPQNLDLLNDPQFAALQLNRFKQRVGRDYQIELTTWCADYAGSSFDVDQATIHIDAISLDWDITPWAKNRSQPIVDLDFVHFYDYGSSTQFVDLGTSLWQSGQWSIDQSPLGAGSNASKIWGLVEDKGQHSVTYLVNHTNGCISEETRQVKIVVDGIYIPSAFTPNHDGLNDEFKAVVTDPASFESYELKVFDRFGHLIFESKNPDAGWDGSFRGERVQDDVYIFSLVFKAHLQPQKALQGKVTVLR